MKHIVAMLKSYHYFKVVVSMMAFHDICNN